MIDPMAFLYVEDDELSRQIMQTIIQRVMGYQHLYIFENSENFEDRVVALPITPTIIFLDIHLRPLDGFELLKLIRANPSFHAVKVVALTASVMNEEVDQLKQSGFDGAISKPLSLDTFPPLIPRILQGEVIWHVG